MYHAYHYRPGHGAPTIDNRKKRFTEHQFDKLRTNGPETPGQFSEEFRPAPAPSHRRFDLDQMDSGDALAFGRPGCGAPNRTKSGRIRTAIFGNPEIRFQANESVKKTIDNNIRYTADRGMKEEYGHQLEEQIRERKETEDREKQMSKEYARQLVSILQQ